MCNHGCIIHPHWVHWWVLLVHSGHQMWLFFDDEDLEFAGGIGSMTSTTMNLKKF
jgi:hypothetical protein